MINLEIEKAIPLREQIYKQLKYKILNGKILPSEILVENRLSKQFKISRTPIREALHFLEKEGLLEGIPMVGYRIRQIDGNELEEIFEIRKVNEVLAARWAIKRISSEQIQVLKDNLALSEVKIKEGNLASFVDLAGQFHDIIAQASGNKRLIDIIQALRGDMLRYRIKSLHLSDTAFLSLTGHRLIYECIIDHDYSGVEKAIRKHLEQAKKYINLYVFGNKSAESYNKESEN